MSKSVDNATKMREIQSVLDDEAKLASTIESLEKIAKALNKKWGSVNAELDALGESNGGERGKNVRKEMELSKQLLAISNEVGAVMSLLQLLTKAPIKAEEILNLTVSEINLPPTAIAVLIPSLAGQLEVSTKK